MYSIKFGRPVNTIALCVVLQRETQVLDGGGKEKSQFSVKAENSWASEVSQESIHQAGKETAYWQGKGRKEASQFGPT